MRKQAYKIGRPEEKSQTEVNERELRRLCCCWRCVTVLLSKGERFELRLYLYRIVLVRLN